MEFYYEECCDDFCQWFDDWYEYISEYEDIDNWE